MAAIMPTDVTDLVNGTLKKYGKNFMTDAMSELQRYIAAERLLSKKRMVSDGGQSYNFNVITRADNNSRAIGLFEVDDTDIVDGSVQGTIPWRFLETSTGFDVKEVSVNSGPERIFNLVKTREYQMWQGFWALVEQYFWDGPASSDDSKVPFGLLKYWFDYDATTGFNGGNHTNFSSGPAGVSCDTYSRWKHFTFNYSAVSDSDAIRSMREAFVKTDFRGIPNKPVKDYDDGVGHRYGIYTVYDTVRDMEELLDSKNDNVKNELAKYDGVTVFKRTPVEYVPYLEENHSTSAPIIGLDWNDFETVTLKGEWMRQTPYKVNPHSHDGRVRYVNSSFNFCMRNRRRHFMGAKSNPMSD